MLNLQIRETLKKYNWNTLLIHHFTNSVSTLPMVQKFGKILSILISHGQQGGPTFHYPIHLLVP